MLKILPNVDRGLGKLHKEIAYFIEAAGTRSKWPDGLFREKFYKAVVLKSAGLEKKLKRFFDEYRALPQALRAELSKEFGDHNRIRHLCSTKGRVTREWKGPGCSKFEKATSELFEFMYSNTFQTKSFKIFAGQSIRDHYKEFRKKYDLSMCPFCGLETYRDFGTEWTGRDAYDHYLYKAAYPFAAVNPANLFPMCTVCNSDFKKQTDVLFGKNLHRRRAPYPLDDAFQLNVAVEKGFEGPPRVSISLKGAGTARRREKFSTWVEVLSIQKRYQTRIEMKRKDWLTEIAEGAKPVTVASLRRAMTKECRRMEGTFRKRMQAELIVHIPFIRYCIKNVGAVVAFFAGETEFRAYLGGRAAVLRT